MNQTAYLIEVESADYTVVKILFELFSDGIVNTGRFRVGDQITFIFSAPLLTHMGSMTLPVDSLESNQRILTSQNSERDK